MSVSLTATRGSVFLAGTIEEREIARSKPVDGPYPEMATAIRAALGYFDDRKTFYTARRAAMKARINNNTMSNMVKGVRGNEVSTRAFARAFGIDEGELMKLSGYLVPESSKDGSGTDLPPIERISFDEALEVYAQTNEITREEYEAIKAIRQRKLKEKYE